MIWIMTDKEKVICHFTGEDITQGVESGEILDHWSDDDEIRYRMLGCFSLDELSLPEVETYRAMRKRREEMEAWFKDRKEARAEAPKRYTLTFVRTIREESYVNVEASGPDEAQEMANEMIWDAVPMDVSSEEATGWELDKVERCRE